MNLRRFSGNLGKGHVRVTSIDRGLCRILLRFPSGVTAEIRTESLECPELAHLGPAMVGDEMPFTVSEEGNILIEFGKRRRA